MTMITTMINVDDDNDNNVNNADDTDDNIQNNHDDDDVGNDDDEGNDDERRPTLTLWPVCQSELTARQRLAYTPQAQVCV
jgi:hypothetical protein